MSDDRRSISFSFLPVGGDEELVVNAGPQTVDLSVLGGLREDGFLRLDAAVVGAVNFVPKVEGAF